MATKNIPVLSKLAAALRGANDDVAALRDRRLGIIEKIDAVRAAPATPAEVAVRVDAVLDAAEHSVRGWAVFGNLASADGGSVDLSAALRNQPLGLLSLFGRDAVRSRLIAEAVAAKPGKAIERAVREAELAKLAGELDVVERAEERAIREAEEAGAVIHRRADANPAMYLAEEL